MTTPVTYTKKMIEKYDIRGGKVSYALITLDDGYGDINIQSDWGEYSYCWTSRGRDRTLKKFLLGCDPSYIKDKFSYGCGGHKYLYGDESRKELKRIICQTRRDCEIDKEQARNAYSEIKDVDYYSFESVRQSFEPLESLVEIFPDWYYGPPGIVTGVKPHLNYFMEIVWTEFMKILREEGK